MKLMNCGRANQPLGARLEHTSGEVVPVRFLKLRHHHELGGLVLSHLVTSHDEPPDHVFGRAGVLGALTGRDFSGPGWALHHLPLEKQTALERLPGNPPEEHVVVLSDSSGTVLLFDVASPSEADAVMGTIKEETLMLSDAVRRSTLYGKAVRKVQQTGHVFAGSEPNVCINVGWDCTFNTYFAHVWDGGELERGDLLLWLGNEPGQVETINGLMGPLDPFGEIPPNLVDHFRLLEFE